MKACLVLVFLSVLKFGENFQFLFSKHRFMNLAKVVNIVVQKEFDAAKTGSFICSGQCETSIFSDFSDELLKDMSSSSKAPIQLESSMKMSAIMKSRNEFLCLFIVNFEGFLKIFSKVSSENFKFNKKILIVLLDGKIPEIEKIFRLLWEIQIFNVNVVFKKNNGDVSVETFMPFSDGKCRSSKPVIIDAFVNGKFVKNVKDFFPEKMKNLENCEITVAISTEAEPHIFVKTSLNGSLMLRGKDISLIRVLSEKLNFRINFTYVGELGFVLDNGTTEGSWRALKERRADLSISNWGLKPNRLKIFDASTAYFSEKIIFVVPPGKEFGMFDKLLFPFKPFLWILLSFSFFAGIFSIFIIKRKSKKIQNFVFGEKVKHPSLNLLTACIGGSQNILPKRNFARFLLAIFLLYSLVIRSLYQGSYFKHLQSDERHQEVQSIQEIIDKKLKIFCFIGVVDTFKGSEKLKKR